MKITIYRILLIKSILILSIATLIAKTETPINIALWFVQTYPDLFRSHFNVWRENKKISDQIIAFILSQKLAGDWVTRELNSMGDMENKSMEEQALTIKNNLQNKILHFNGTYETPLWTFQRLVAGSSLCDGYNHLHGLLLNQFHPQISLFALWDPIQKESPHTLLKINNTQVSVYIDFFMEPLVTTDERVHRKSSLGASQTILQSHSSFPPSFYANGFVMKTMVPMLFNFGTLRLFKTDPSSGNWDPPRDSWLAYLRGRIFHLYHLEKPAKEHYQQVVNNHCQEAFCQTARLFLNILSERDSPPRRDGE
ncbi:MAG: hypothetical protein H7833_06640 [Magnetococcus sp. DMHC-1]